MQDKNGERESDSSSGRLWWAKSPPVKSVVRGTKEGGKMERPKVAEGGNANLQPLARPTKSLGSMRPTLHRVQISPQEVDALAMREALERLSVAGLKINAVDFSMASRVTRQADGGLTVEVGG